MTDETLLPAPPRASDEALADLTARLRSRREVADPWADDETRGLGPGALGALLDRWADGFSWREHEQRIAALPWRLVGRGDDAVRLLHQRSANAAAPVVVLLHGWPDSVLRFERLLPLLTDMHVVVPAMPGFPFAAPHAAPASVHRIADLVVAAVTELGHDRFTVSGGDVGGDVAEIIADAHPDRVAAMHLTNVSARHVFSVDPAELAPDARAYIGRAMDWNRAHGGYVVEQSTRPRTLLTGLGDSPAGLAAWILEKVLAWTADPERSFTTDELLTWVSAYWFTGTVGTSFATYTQPASVPRRTRVPTVVSAFAGEIKPAPRSWAEAFVDLREHLPHDTGGHFAAWEEPDAYAEDLRRATALAVGA